MKLCVIGLRGIPGVSGGIETHCENLYEQLARQRPDLEIVVFGRKPYIGEALHRTASGIKVVPAFAWNNKHLETITNTFVAILSARLSERAKIVHLHAIGPGLLAPMARLLGMKVVLTHHGDDYRREKWNGIARLALRLGERYGVLSAAQVIAVSENVTQRLRRAFPEKRERIHYLPNGADHIVRRSAKIPAKAVLDRFGLEPQEYVITVGRLVPEKGFADLIAAHRKAQSRRPLVIIGGGSHSSHDRELKAMAHEGVIFTGTLPQGEVGRLLEHARLFVLPSHHEGLPIAALEAWAMGARLLLSDIVPNRDLGLPEEHYFGRGDIPALSERLVDDAPLPPSRPLPEDYNWSVIARRTAAIYDSIGGGGRGTLAASTS
jgi:glycosyltransferase involved in cell wall biosynthesis